VKSEAALLVCLVLVLVAILPSAPTSGAASGPLPDIGLGFGPSNVQPISQGFPIYTQGDNVWVESYYNFTIDLALIHPDGSSATGVVVVEPGQLFMMYTFLGNDSSGVWQMSVTTPAGISEFPLVLGTPDSSLVPRFGGVHLEGNKLNQTFDLPPTDAYNIQMCTVGQSTGHGFGFGLAGGLNGTVVLSLSGNSTQFAVSGIASPLSAWLELYSQYTYSLSGGGTVSQNLQVANTPVLSVSPPGISQLVTLSEQMPLRQGRFDLRVFDRTTSGLSLHDAQFLRTSNGTWLSLNSCTSLVNLNSHEVFLTTNLDSANTSWPRHLFTMYSLNGEESYSETAVPGAEAAIHLKDFPEGRPLSGVTITPSAQGLLSSDWDASNSSVYFDGGIPSTVTLGLSFSEVALENLNVTIPGPYSSKTLSVVAGTLVASAILQGKTLTNATISVGTPGSPPVVIKQSTPGTSLLLLPPGIYNVSATYSGVSSNEPVSVTEGHISTVTVDLDQPAFPTTLYLLAAVGAAGVAANIFIWRQYIERRKVYG